MKKFLEKIIHTVIPHEKNGNIPHILKEEFIFVLVIFVGVLFYFNQNNFSIIRNLNLTATVYPAMLADLANKDRAISGIHELAWSITLENAAKLKANDMVKNEYFAHTSPDGVSPWHWLKETDYNFIYAGENLAINFTESENVEKAWINSPKHKENILNSHFTEIGIATVDGIFEGKETTFVVEFFGKPARKEIPEKLAVNKNIETNNLNKVITSSVAGASTENIEVVEESADFIIVKNDMATEELASVISNNLKNKHLSTWYNRFIVNPVSATRIIYTIIFCLVLVAILLVRSKEYQKHHTKHIVMGTIFIILIAALLYIISM